MQTVNGRLVSKENLLIHWADGSKERLSSQFQEYFKPLKDGDHFRADVELDASVVVEVFGVWRE